MRQLGAAPGSLISHQMNQPPEPPRQHHASPRQHPRQTTSCHHRRHAVPAANMPARPHPLHQRQQTVLHPRHPLMHRHNQFLRQCGGTPTPTQARSHGPAHPRGDLPKLARTAGKEGKVHELNKKTKPGQQQAPKLATRIIDAHATFSSRRTHTCTCHRSRCRRQSPNGQPPTRGVAFDVITTTVATPVQTR